LNEGVVLGRIPIISRTGVGVVIFLSRGMMEMMQQVVHLCRQRKSKNCCVVFHFDAKIGWYWGNAIEKKQETRTKSQEARDVV
jgi:hypothetical protein